MKRLREIEAPSPLVEKAQALIESIDPVPVSHERMLRIRRELDAPRGVLVSARRLPALAMAALVVLFGGSAFAAVRIYVAVRASTAQPASEQPAGARDAAHKQHRTAQHTTPLSADPADAVERAASEASTPALEQPAQPAARTEPRGHVKSQAQVGARSKVSTQSAVTNDSKLVYRAVRALRRDGDPALAARLLDESRIHNPEGALAEEALSLQIEAAVELGEPRARKLALEYLARYPNGRYLPVARSALEDTTP